jgi:hypothetical protein
MAAGDSKVGFWPLLFVWAATAAIVAGRAIWTSTTVPLFLDTDDAMRLTEVHDFLGGQNWFDLVQHRLNTPYGAEMHWSRLIDLPEATLIFVLRPFFAESVADVVAAYIWPLALLAILLWASAKLALRLSARAALWPALLLPPFGIITLTEFVPGRLDHHSVQALLTLAMLYCAIAALDRPRFAVGAGVLGGVALAIGIEGLPLVGATAALFALMWICSRKHANAMRDFGMSFGLATTMALAQGVPPARWPELRVDAISLVYTAAALLCGAAFLVLSLLPLKRWIVRLAVALLAACIIAGLLLALDPAILKGPYAMLDPWLVSNWLSHISEAETWLQSFTEDPVYPVAVTVPVLLALATCVWNAVRLPADRAAWLLYAVMLVVGLAVMMIQIRAARIATPLAVPACAGLIASAWQAFRAQNRVLPALGVFTSAAASTGLVVAAITALVAPLAPDADKIGNGPRSSCFMPSAFADLAGLPSERVMAPVDLGSHLLLFTPHAVVGAPYHRNQQGLLDTFHFFNDPIDQARHTLETRGISLVVICPALSEIRGIVEHAPDSFVSLYAQNKLPAWLVDHSLPGAPLKIYSVTPR